MSKPLFQGNDRLKAEQTLRVDESLYSNNGRFNATLQRDGDLVVYDNQNNKKLWSSNTAGTKNPSGLVVQADFNTCLYHEAGTPYWATSTWHKAKSGIALIMQDDGNFVLYGDGTAYWHSNTAQH